ncbi:C4-dicarboxylate transporter/malic acid transport protein [Edwardsiella anguillarum]|uniref:SLAC1 anion channel family protein n=1 Tax=Edwardsiella TaxID=635 RepID=UPI0009DDC805|nr:SLAC1 anion channel family protein [Edwardsiella anguillarum]RFS99666.1 C4-dicarboxylate ABC transporter [Edwardsiella anguillarum]BET80143.1 C4-dicarboxylate transporter/malic acid transport protein [Edwardsiella anguillarum]BET83432.1 C4-dicarboxylate transporter/malic acid transport protein [Edwardsiella anguillarum]BET86799.1 C4-dicarboxylate transporter/malic acid transport protein [Edwardsiella anguillarum]BET90225.1 C4-dicarboxylate transporter/malic acid transport protein [Edwardsie
MAQTEDTLAALGSPVNAARRSPLDHLPVALFGSVMGLAGLAAAWQLAGRLFGLPHWIAQGIGLFALLVFVVLSVAYIIKIIGSPAVVSAEFRHPIAGNLFGTPLISLLLLPMIIADYCLPLARAVWAIGAVGMVWFAWFSVTRWLSQRQQTAHATPAWMVPVVGLIDLPLAMPALQLQTYPQMMMFALAIGLFFALPLFTLILSRLLFDTPLPVALQPSLLILLAPFSVGFSSYVTTLGQVDAFADALYMLTLFLLCVLIGRVQNLPRTCPFRLSWWSVSFPLASSAGSALRYAAHHPGPISQGIALLLLAVVSLLLLWMVAYTVHGIARGRLRTLAG